MVSGFTTYTMQKVLEHVLKNTVYTPAATVYVSLFVGDPLGAGTEEDDSGYTRQAITFGAYSFSSPSGSITNSTDITFGTIADGATTIDYWAIYDASTSGNMLLTGTFTPSKTFNIGDQITAKTGNLTSKLTQT